MFWPGQLILAKSKLSLALTGLTIWKFLWSTALSDDVIIFFPQSKLQCHFPFFLPTLSCWPFFLHLKKWEPSEGEFQSSHDSSPVSYRCACSWAPLCDTTDELCIHTQGQVSHLHSSSQPLSSMHWHCSSNQFLSVSFIIIICSIHI